MFRLGKIEIIAVIKNIDALSKYIGEKKMITRSRFNIQEKNYNRISIMITYDNISEFTSYKKLKITTF